MFMLICNLEQSTRLFLEKLMISSLILGGGGDEIDIKFPSSESRVKNVPRCHCSKLGRNCPKLDKKSKFSLVWTNYTLKSNLYDIAISVFLEV